MMHENFITATNWLLSQISDKSVGKQHVLNALQLLQQLATRCRAPTLLHNLLAASVNLEALIIPPSAIKADGLSTDDFLNGRELPQDVLDLLGQAVSEHMERTGNDMLEFSDSGIRIFLYRPANRELILHATGVVLLGEIAYGTA